MLLPYVALQAPVKKIQRSSFVPGSDVVLHLGRQALQRLVDGTVFVRFLQVLHTALRRLTVGLHNGIIGLGNGFHPAADLADADPQHLIVRFAHILSHGVQNAAGLRLKVISPAVEQNDQGVVIHRCESIDQGFGRKLNDALLHHQHGDQLLIQLSLLQPLHQRYTEFVIRKQDADPLQSVLEAGIVRHRVSEKLHQHALLNARHFLLQRILQRRHGAGHLLHGALDQAEFPGDLFRVCLGQHGLPAQLVHQLLKRSVVAACQNDADDVACDQHQRQHQKTQIPGPVELFDHGVLRLDGEVAPSVQRGGLVRDRVRATVQGLEFLRRGIRLRNRRQKSFVSKPRCDLPLRAQQTVKASLRFLRLQNALKQRVLLDDKADRSIGRPAGTPKRHRMQQKQFSLARFCLNQLKLAIRTRVLEFLQHQAVHFLGAKPCNPR